MPPSDDQELSVVLDDRASTQLARINREVQAIGGGPSNLLPRAPHEVPLLRAVRDFVIGNETRALIGTCWVAASYRRQRGVANAQIGGPLSGANRKSFTPSELYRV
jgi:hypothetical protein